MRAIRFIHNFFIIILFFSLGLLCAGAMACEVSLFSGPQSESFLYLEKHARNFDKLTKSQLHTVLRVTEPFIGRLKVHDFFWPFYKRLLESPDYLRRFPPISRNPQKIDICFVPNNKKLVDYKAYRHLKGMRVADIFPEAEGDDRLMDEAPAESSNGLLYVPFKYIGVPAGLQYDYYAHEFGHFLHFNFMLPEEMDALEHLYQTAVREGRALDDYAAMNVGEYFAQGLEAYFARNNKPPVDYIYWDHTPEELKKRDPALFDFIERLIARSNDLPLSISL